MEEELELTAQSSIELVSRLGTHCSLHNQFMMLQ